MASLLDLMKAKSKTADTDKANKLAEKAETKRKLEIAFASENKPSIIPPKNKRAKVWEKFGHPVLAEETVVDFAVCKECFMIYSYDKGGSTTTMNSHACKIELSSHKQTTMNRHFVSKSKQLPSTAATRLNEAAVMFAARDMRPMYMFEGEGFMAFTQAAIDIAAVHGRYDINTELADRTTLTSNHLRNLHTTKLAEITETLAACDAIAHTLDIWQDKYTNRSYASLTCLYITDDFEYKKLLYSTSEFPYASKTKVNMEKWYTDNIPLPDRIHTVTVDNCANNNGLPDRVSCSAHCVNLVVQVMLEGKQSTAEAAEVHSLVQECKSLVQYAKRTSLNSKLPSTLKQSCSVRWNSILTMLLSISKVWDELTLELSSSGQLSHLEPINRELLDELIKFLMTFRQATDILEADTKPTIHKVHYWIHRIQTALQPGGNSDEVEKVKAIGLQHMKKKWQDRMIPLHSAGLLMDPCGKLSATEDQRQAGVDLIRQRMQVVKPSETENNEHPRASTSQPSEVRYFAESDDDDEDFYGKGPVKPTGDELDLYLDEPRAPKGTKPLVWWKSNSHKYPTLSRVARMILCVPASSATSERAFSAAGYTINQRRVRLDPNNVNRLLFLRSACGLNPFETPNPVPNVASL